MTGPRRTDRVRATCTMALALAQPLATRASRWSGRGSPETGRAAASEGPTTPAAGAFVIWAPLFAGSLSFAVGGLAGDRLSDPAARSAGWWVNAALAGNVLWSLNAQFRGLDAVSLALISGSAAAATTAVVRADRGGDTLARRSLRRCIAPLAGWLSVAAFANLETTLNRRRTPSRDTATRRSIGLLAAAATTATGTAAVLREPRPYVLAAAWGLGGIAVKAVRNRSWPVAGAAVLGGAAVASHLAPEVAHLSRARRAARPVR